MPSAAYEASSTLSCFCSYSLSISSVTGLIFAVSSESSSFKSSLLSFSTRLSKFTTLELFCGVCTAISDVLITSLAASSSAFLSSFTVFCSRINAALPVLMARSRLAESSATSASASLFASASSNSVPLFKASSFFLAIIRS